MPVTPFHMGPAVLLKAGLGRSMSLGSFGITQVVIDVESVGNILTGRFPVHDRLHTLPGALVVAGVVTLISRAPLAIVYARIRKRPGVSSWLSEELVEPTWLAVAVGAFLGGVSHVILDGMMHSDSRPLSPLVAGNPLLVPNSFEAIHLGCAAVGIVGFIAWRAVLALRKPS